MSEKQEEQIQTAVKLPSSLMKRLDKIAQGMSQPGLNPVTRTEVIRLFILRGAEQTEQQQKKR